jgi:hypothetical protein
MHVCMCDFIIFRSFLRVKVFDIKQIISHPLAPCYPVQLYYHIESKTVAVS